MKFTVPAFDDFGGEGKTIHFAHANGYPSGSYQLLFNQLLPKYHIISSHYRPLWPSPPPAEELSSWTELAADLIRFFDHQGLKNIIGVGHSMGGTISLLAAHKRPDLFQRLILLDPIIVSEERAKLFETKSHDQLIADMKIAQIAARRKNQWNTLQEVYDSWRAKVVFRKFSDESLNVLVKNLIKPNQEGVTLVYPKEWETQIYITIPYVFNIIDQLEMPVSVIRAEYGHTLNDAYWKAWKAKTPQNDFIDFKGGGHLFPLEAPVRCAETMLRLLKA